MSDIMEYLGQLEQALLEKHGELEKKVLPDLKENLRSFQSAFTSIHKLLMDKGLLQADPYKYEQKTDLTPPSSDPFIESEASREVSFRMTAFSGTLDYMNNFFHISSDTLDLSVIKKILGLLDYIKWTDFSPNSSQIMTRTIAVLLEKVNLLKDDMSTLVITSALGQLRDRSKEIKGALKKISSYQRERYKFQVRSLITSQMTDLNDSTLKEGVNEAIMAIKMEFPASLPNTPFFRELIQELLNEDYTANKEQLRKLALHNLEVQGITKKKVKKEVQRDFRKELWKVLGLISKCSTQMSTSYTKLESNHKSLHERKKTFGEALSYWLKNVFGSKKKGESYEISIVDPMTSLKKKEVIVYATFTDKLVSRIQALRNIETKTSALHEKLKSAGEKQLFQFIEDNIHDLRSFHRRLEGFERYFKQVREPEIKPKIKSMKIDLDTLKYQIGNITRQMNEVSATIEEEKQLKALGIDDTAN